jgi:Na+-transporting NADH:ubiquinone oxidoreductase subunit NqrC
MSTFTIIIIFGILISIFASVLIVAAAMLSSRISQQEPVVERYDRIMDAPKGVPSPYSLRS